MQDPVQAMLERLKALLSKQYGKPASKRASYQTVLAQVVREAGFNSRELFRENLKLLSKAHADDKKRRREIYGSQPFYR